MDTTILNLLNNGEATADLIRNVGLFLPPVMALIGLVVWLVRLESAVKELRKDTEDMDKTVNGHVTNNDAHVNHLHIGNLERRIGTLETSVREIGREMVAGHEKISEKIDAKFEQLTRVVNSK